MRFCARAQFEGGYKKRSTSIAAALAIFFLVLLQPTEGKEDINMWTVSALCLTVVVAVISAQPDDAECGNLGFSRPRPRIRGTVTQLFQSSSNALQDDSPRMLIFRDQFSFLYTFHGVTHFSTCTGDNLPVCRSSEEQCCSSEYLEGVQERVRERLEKFLRKEFDDVIEEYQDEVDNLLECELL